MCVCLQTVYTVDFETIIGHILHSGSVLAVYVNIESILLAEYYIMYLLYDCQSFLG